jgi:hypothetical protein
MKEDPASNNTVAAKIVRVLDGVLVGQPWDDHGWIDSEPQPRPGSPWEAASAY